MVLANIQNQKKTCPPSPKICGGQAALNIQALEDRFISILPPAARLQQKQYIIV
jgi:hypothetical protein